MSAAAPKSATLTVGVPASTGEDDLAATLASLAASAARATDAFEIVVAVNGPDEPAPAVAGVEAFARAAGLPLVPPTEPPPAAGACVRLLRLAPRSKVAAWNAIRAAARAPITAADGLVARVAALPHRFDFGNVPGRLYALRAAALPEPMPESVLHEDAYLSVRLGRARFAKEPGAVVRLRPPTTWSEYLRQRIRNEVGKLQLVHEFPELYRQHGFGTYPWRRFVREIAPREYPLVALSMAARAFARVRALRQIRHGVARGWAVLPSTKRWPAGDGAART